MVMMMLMMMTIMVMMTITWVNVDLPFVVVVFVVVVVVLVVVLECVLNCESVRECQLWPPFSMVSLMKWPDVRHYSHQPTRCADMLDDHKVSQWVVFGLTILNSTHNSIHQWDRIRLTTLI